MSTDFPDKMLEDVHWALDSPSDRKALEYLAHGLKIPDLSERCCIALSKVGRPAVGHLKELVKTKDQELWREAAKALGRIGDAEVTTDLVEAFLAKPADPQTKALHWYDLFEALELIGKLSVDTLIGIMRDSRYLIRIRIGAVNALSDIGGLEAIEGLAEALHNDDFRDYFNSKCVNVKYLLRKTSRSDIHNLLFVLPDWHWGTQVLELLEELGWQPATDEERVHYYVACRDGNALLRNLDATRKVLIEDVTSGNQRRLENAVYAFVGIGQEECILELIGTLEEHGTKDIAVMFLNSGNSTLKDAAISWAHRHGYEIIPWGGFSVGWGSMLS